MNSQLWTLIFEVQRFFNIATLEQMNFYISHSEKKIKFVDSEIYILLFNTNVNINENVKVIVVS